MPEMETKFPDYTEKLTEFAVKKPIFITYNFVNSSACFLYFSISLMFLRCQVCQQTVRLIFFTLQVAYLKLDIFRLLHFTALCLFLSHAFFLGYSKESKHSAIAKPLMFYVLLQDLYVRSQKLKPGKMNVGWT